MPGSGKQSPAVQAQIKALLEAGFDPTTIHRRLKVGRSSIYRMKRCLQQHGTPYMPPELNKKNGRPKVLTADQELEVLAWLRTPANRTRYLDDLVWLIHDRCGIVCSTTTMSKLKRKWMAVLACEEAGTPLDDLTVQQLRETHPDLPILQGLPLDGGPSTLDDNLALDGGPSTSEAQLSLSEPIAVMGDMQAAQSLDDAPLPSQQPLALPDAVTIPDLPADAQPHAASIPDLPLQLQLPLQPDDLSSSLLIPSTQDLSSQHLPPTMGVDVDVLNAFALPDAIPALEGIDMTAPDLTAQVLIDENGMIHAPQIDAQLEQQLHDQMTAAAAAAMAAVGEEEVLQ